MVFCGLLLKEGAHGIVTWHCARLGACAHVSEVVDTKPAEEYTPQVPLPQTQEHLHVKAKSGQDNKESHATPVTLKRQ